MPVPGVRVRRGGQAAGSRRVPAALT